MTRSAEHNVQFRACFINGISREVAELCQKTKELFLMCWTEISLTPLCLSVQLFNPLSAHIIFMRTMSVSKYNEINRPVYYII